MGRIEPRPGHHVLVRHICGHALLLGTPQSEYWREPFSALVNSLSSILRAKIDKTLVLTTTTTDKTSIEDGHKFSWHK